MANRVRSTLTWCGAALCLALSSCGGADPAATALVAAPQASTPQATVLAARSPASTAYKLTVLDKPGWVPARKGINSCGLIAISARTVPGWGSFVSDGETTKPIPAPGDDADHTEVRAINSSGQIVGQWWTR